ncbi:MAG: ATP-binding protein, partial [Tepidisphaeraceae bacterium]
MPTNIQPDMFDDLRAQHDFVEKQKEQPDPFNLIVPEAFVQSIRDLGYRSTYTALDELIDNGVQANAKLINIFPAFVKDNKSQKKPDYIVVADDGHGMEPDMIRLAVKWGGTHRHDDRRGFGRFGFGLPSSCVSIGRAYTVYSKPVNGDWHAVTVDIDEVAKQATSGKGTTTTHRKEQPPKFVIDQMDVTKFASGTVIVIETLDRLDRGSKLSSSFVKNAMEHFGVVYRKMIPNIDLRVAGDKVKPVDPLFLDPNARWYDDWPVKAKPFEGFEFEAKNSKGETGTIRVRAAWFPFNFHLKDPNGPFNAQNRNDRFKIMKEYNGIMVCRAGRQIDFTMTSPWHTFVNFDRFWKIEIDFDPVLDEMF